eukprot:744753-Pleurochrysis_carterae.AAC.1
MADRRLVALVRRWREAAVQVALGPRGEVQVRRLSGCVSGAPGFVVLGPAGLLWMSEVLTCQERQGREGWTETRRDE